MDIELPSHSIKMRVLASVIFIILAMIIGIVIVCLTSPKPDQTCQRTFNRTMKSSLSYSPQPHAVTLAYINDDNHLDLILANSGTNTIGVFLSTPNGSFTNQTIYSTGPYSRPYSIVVDDFNHDNCSDIVVANFDANNIGIFYGRANGTFNDQKILVLGSLRPLFIKSGDFNSDSRPDLIVINYGHHSISILLGDGHGWFQNPTIYFTGHDSLPVSVAVADLNEDNRLDIVIANAGTNNIGLFFGHGNGTFADQIIYSTGHNSNPCSVAIRDVNNDSHLDIIVANNGTKNIGLFLGHANRSFTTQAPYQMKSKSSLQFIDVGYFNNDSSLDLVIVDSQNDQVHFILGYGNGQFAPMTTYDMISGSTPTSVAVGDLNRDNRSDVVIVTAGTSNVFVLIDYRNQSSARQKNYDTGPPSYTTSVSVGDFDNDRILDLVFNGYEGVIILNGVGDGTFIRTNTSVVGEYGSTHIWVGDVNNDTQIDIVVAYRRFDMVRVFLGDGNGRFSTHLNYSTGVDSAPLWIAVGDVNNDGYNDIVSANSASESVGVFFGRGNGTFGTMMDFPTGSNSQPSSVALGDFDHDNYLDCVVISWTGNVTIYRGNGDGTFVLMLQHDTGKASATFSCVLSDFNNDTHLDIGFTVTFKYCFTILLGNGDGTFRAATSYPTGSSSEPYGLIAVDLNNDRIYDIAIADLGSDEVIIFYGDGHGSFQRARNYPTGFGTQPYALTAADLDNDKQLELVVALWGSGDLAILSEYSAASFTHQTIYSAGSVSRPVSVTVGDLNNDNKTDIVVANAGTDSLGILLGLGHATFGIQMNYSLNTDSHPQQVIICDINRDNQQDLISVNSKNNSVSIIEGNGDGTFKHQMIFTTGFNSEPSSVAAGDLNNDGRMDFVVANEGSDSVGIFYGFNYSAFLSQEKYSNNASFSPSGIVVDDLNNDGYVDVAAVFKGNDTLGILFGYGNGSFRDLKMYSTGDGSQLNDIGIGDLNNDHRKDIVITRNEDIGVFMGYGNGTFAAMITYPIKNCTSPNSITVVDLNGDGLSDVITASFTGHKTAVLLARRDGSLSNADVQSLPKNAGPSSIVTGDFNNDHRLDLVVAAYEINKILVFRGHGNGSFDRTTLLSETSIYTPYSVDVGDFDNDKQLDIVVTNWNYNGVVCLRGLGNGSFEGEKWYSTGSGASPTCVRGGDFNNDQKLDIAVVNQGTGGIVVLFGLGDGSFLLGTAYSTGWLSSPLSLAIGDFNNDSRLDVAVSNELSNSISIFLGDNHKQPFAGMSTYPIEYGSRPRSVAVGDLNNDSRFDIVVGNYGKDNIGILFGQTNRTFTNMIKYPLNPGSAPQFVVIADLNNDTRLDIVVASSGDDSIVMLFNMGNTNFQPPIIYKTRAGSHPLGIAIGDLDNDNRIDIVVANSGLGEIFFLYGSGNGTFREAKPFSLGYGYNPVSVVVADLNGDNRLDIIIACYSTDHIETLIKMC